MAADLEIRLAAFKWLQEQTEIHGDVLPRSSLLAGFMFRENRVPLVSPQGIFKPALMDLPLTITTTPNSPYRDRYTNGNFLHYKYRGQDPGHPDNIGLRQVMQKQLPLIYFFGLVPGRYLAIWPVFIIDDNPRELTFTVAVEDLTLFDAVDYDRKQVSEEDLGRRAYLTTTTKIRLHQRSFREKVLQAYRTQCAFCRLRHRELLDAAHIIPDREEQSTSTVNNGLSLCKLHHAAYDSLILGISPDYILVVRDDVLDEEDGPTLRYGLQGLNQQNLILPSRPSDWPSRDALDWKYQKFLQAA